MNSDTPDDLRIGPEILKQQAELYRRLRNTLRWLLGSLAGFDESERVPDAELPELERWVLHRLAELDGKLRQAAAGSTTGPASIRRSTASARPTCRPSTSTSARTRCTATRPTAPAGAPPAPCWTRCTAASAPGWRRCWLHRGGSLAGALPGEADSIHLHDFPDLPGEWRDEALAARWTALRARRAIATQLLEELRRSGEIGSSLQAKVIVAPAEAEAGFDPAFWEEILIVSQAERGEGAAFQVAKAPGSKCDRCWRVLPEVGASAAHPTLCRRCEAVVTAAA